MRDPQDRDECKREANSKKRGITEDWMDRDVQMGYDPVDDWVCTGMDTSYSNYPSFTSYSQPPGNYSSSNLSYFGSHRHT